MVDDDEDEDPAAFLNRQVALFSKIGGGVVGVASAVAAHNPIVGVIVAPVIASNLERLGKEFIERQLGPQQRKRVGAVIALTIVFIQERLAGGDNPRDDGLYGAEDLTEAGLDAAIKAFEEEKIQLIARLMANIFFDPTVDKPTAFLLIELANRLSYRQLLVVKITGDVAALKFQERPETGSTPSIREMALLSEIFLMSQLGLIASRRNGASNHAVLTGAEIEPKFLVLEPLGGKLLELMQLEEYRVADNYLSPTIALLHEISLAGQRSTAIDGGNEFG